MMNSDEDKAYASNKIRKQSKNLSLVLVGAIIFAFLMGILANATVNCFTLNTFTRQLFLKFLIPTLIAAAILVYFIYYYYAFVQYSRIKWDMPVTIIYDIHNAEVIDDPFDGYHPQKLSWQAFFQDNPLQVFLPRFVFSFFTVFSIYKSTPPTCGQLFPQG